ncbi:hypothetical protein [Streptomyces sp. NPDC001450]
MAAQLRWRHARGIAVAYLYRLDLAKPVRPMTPGRWQAHEAMMRPHRICPECGNIRASLGTCEPCDPTRMAA